MVVVVMVAIAVVVALMAVIMMVVMIVVMVVEGKQWSQLTGTDCTCIPVTVLSAFPVLHGHMTL